MGHYDECREGYCGKCGQTEGNCEHTRKPVTPNTMKVERDTMEFYITKIDIDHIDATTYGARQLKLVQGYMTINYFVVRGAIKIDCSVRIPTDMNLTLQQLTDKVASIHGGVSIANS